MKAHLYLAVAFAVLMLAGCSRTQPIHNVTQTLNIHYSDNQLKTAILQAGADREWVMQPVQLGVINGHLAQRGHVADIRITYSASQYQINYVASQNLLAGAGQIHRNYNRWVTNLDRQIQLRLAGQQQ
ncbi:hypothetical protein [Erwinia sp. B116]|uniref:hypothetical protein n=1 Tax=Erwinia sp. B116 TaxID=1561024 RepID=UPI000C7901C7|nr:hypothetical protein [Erwinia sp. B116]PLV62112.1 lipoprotein [Erwinia sp. B116]